MFVSFEKFQLGVWKFSNHTLTTASGRNVHNGTCESYHIWDCLCTWWAESSQWVNNIKYLDFLLWHTEHTYWTTSDSTELPENLLNYLRIYWTTWEFTELPHNLLNYLRIYWTTSQFTELPQIFTELPQIFTELPGFLQVKIIELPGPAEVYYELSNNCTPWSSCMKLGQYLYELNYVSTGAAAYFHNQE